MKNNLIRASVFEFLKVCIFYKLSALFALFTIEQSFILFFILVVLDFVLCLTKISNFRKNIIKLDILFSVLVMITFPDKFGMFLILNFITCLLFFIELLLDRMNIHDNWNLWS